MPRFLSLASVAALALALAAAPAQAGKADKADKANKPAKADRAAKRNADALTGKLEKVDGTTLTILSGRGKKAAQVTVTTDASTKVKVNGKEATLADIKPGMHVVATPNTGTAQKITASDEAPARKNKKNKDNAAAK